MKPILIAAAALVFMFFVGLLPGLFIGAMAFGIYLIARDKRKGGKA